MRRHTKLNHLFGQGVANMPVVDLNNTRRVLGVHGNAKRFHVSVLPNNFVAL